MIHLSGGPSHLDMYDMKPAAPVEYRGEFNPIATNVPGIEICELMPRQATIADKFAILRARKLPTCIPATCSTAAIPGRSRRGRRSLARCAARRWGRSLAGYERRRRTCHRMSASRIIATGSAAYYAGVEHEPVRVGSSSPREAIENMGRNAAFSVERLVDRYGLLTSLDSMRRQAEVEATRGIDLFRARAMEIITSSRLATPLIWKRNRPRTGPVTAKESITMAPHPGRSLLLARRLIEAGVSVVTVGVHGWDTHAAEFPGPADATAARPGALCLVTDLDERGLLDDVVIVMGGEFGRTPRIGDQTPDGRGHWPEAGFLWMAGGGLRTGQTIGATDGRGEQIIGNPIGMQSVLATVYHVLGIDPGTTIPDYDGRPQVVLDQRSPIAALI